jgi:hypothetical protein
MVQRASMSSWALRTAPSLLLEVILLGFIVQVSLLVVIFYFSALVSSNELLVTVGNNYRKTTSS